MTSPAAGVALLGSGGIAQSHAQAFEAAGARVPWVFGTDRRRAESVAMTAPGASATTSIVDVLADPDVSAVVVCGRSADHPERTIAALSAGKHVLVEKPPARTLADFDRMVDAARSADRHLMVGQSVRFQPAIAEMGRQVADGRVGTPRVLHLSWYVGHVWPGAWNSWQLDPGESGGHIAHNGMHPIDLAVWLLDDEPVRVFARGWCTHAADMPTPDSFHLTVRFATGALALIEVSYALASRGDALRRTVLYGTEGTLRHTTAEDDVPSGTEPSARASVADAMVHEAEHFRDVVEGRRPPGVTLEQSRRTLAASLAGQRSLEIGRPVDIAEVEDVA